jgi:DNA-directed RNA polymerase specialized sigma24 family protein
VPSTSTTDHKEEEQVSIADLKGAEAAKAEALDFIARATRRRNGLEQDITKALAVAQENGASLRQIAAVAGVSHETVRETIRQYREREGE